MSKCISKRRRKIKVCIGDMREKIKLQFRSLEAPENGGVDFELTFEDVIEVYAMIETTRGQQFFDGHNLQNGFTHKIYIRYLAGLTAENWLEYRGDKYDIEDIENMDERNEFMILRCNVKGTNTQEVNEL